MAGVEHLLERAALAMSTPKQDPRRLLFHDHVASVDRNPQVLAERLAQHYHLLDFAPRQGHERTFLHRTSTASCGGLVLSGGYTTPIQGRIGERPHIGSVNFMVSGSVSYRSEDGDIQLNPGQPLFFSPGAAYDYAIDGHFNGVVFQLDLNRIRRTAAAMAGLGVSPRRFCPDLERVRVLAPHDPRSRELINVLTQAFTLLDHPELEGMGILQHLPLDDLIYRTLAMLLCPGLESLGSPGSRQRGDREQVFDELVEWARVNLRTPISLSQLEERSGYSRRHLQLSFQARFGCGPIQWIRQQRLEQARQRLLNASPQDTVATVAADFGFSSLSAFSREFRNRFGLRASDLLREGKRRI
jgi:AraC-like DNA-binding protein